MLYDSTKVLLRSILWSLRDANTIHWDDQVEWACECSFEIHQMSRPLYQGYRQDPVNIRPALVPVFERATRAIPHLKLMIRAIRRKDQAAAIASGTAALAEM
jgi:hypothetical protein